MEHLHLILFLAMIGGAVALTCLALLDFAAADRILEESRDDERN